MDGFSDKLPTLVARVFGTAVALAVEPDRFDMAKANYLSLSPFRFCLSILYLASRLVLCRGAGGGARPLRLRNMYILFSFMFCQNRV